MGFGKECECNNLKKIDIGYGVERIEKSAFENCDKLKSIVIPDSVTFLGYQAFYSCDALTEVSLTKALIAKYGKSDYFPSTAKPKELGDNPFSVSGKTSTVKAKKVKKKAQTIAASKLYKMSPATGIYVKKTSGNKKISVNYTTGNITVAKKTKKGTYKIKVQVMSTGNAEYMASDWKTVTITVKVK